MSWRKIAVLLLLLTLAAHAQPTYESELVRVKASDPGVDFAQLRELYAVSPLYQPYELDEESQKAMWAAIEAKDYAGALKLADKLLGDNYLSLDAHLGAYTATRELKDEARAEHHNYVLSRQLQAIFQSGDGKTPATAFKVIGIPEEYAVLAVLGYQQVETELIEQQGHHFDRVKARKPSDNSTVDIYFNVDAPFAWMEKNLK